MDAKYLGNVGKGTGCTRVRQVVVERGARLDGPPLDASGVTSGFQRRLARAGLRRQRFQDLRHACASLLLLRGVSRRVVMEILGHSQIKLTLETYSHVLPGLLSDAAEQLDAVLNTPG
ncbi:MAG TPA: tyrosine-type recombinase/integrase [Candidatus Saccharimonadales bacterium]|nr:tyrosine-type recombinase/integrase [Candidatus Saccharimonadales bacterium]